MKLLPFFVLFPSTKIHPFEFISYVAAKSIRAEPENVGKKSSLAVLAGQVESNGSKIKPHTEVSNWTSYVLKW